MKKLIFGTLFIALVVTIMPLFVGCLPFETSESQRLRAQAELTSAEAYKSETEATAYAVKRQAEAEAYQIRQQAEEEMMVTQQWVNERMFILRQEQKDAALQRTIVFILTILAVIAALSIPAQLFFIYWFTSSQKGRSDVEERRFYSAIIAMQRGRFND